MNLFFKSLLPAIAATTASVSCGSHNDYEDGLYAEFNTTKGLIVCRLEFEKAPLTVANFVGLAEGTISNKAKAASQPYFDGLTFHRVVPNFVIQGGDPAGDGQGGPGYQFPDEFHPDLKHDGPGILSMANAGPGTNGSQFFITHTSTPHLDNKHSVFGKVVKGIEVVNAIQQGDKMETVKIVRVGKKAKNFKADQASFDKLIAEVQKRNEEEKRAKTDAFAKKIGPIYGDTASTASGLVYAVTQQGEGALPAAGQLVTVHYTGYLMDGTKFDSSLDRGQPITFPLGQGKVIKGWDEGIGLLKVGSKATFIIPPHLGYGDGGFPPVIPQSATLVFEVELLNVQ